MKFSNVIISTAAACMFSFSCHANASLENLPGYNQWIEHANTIGKYYLYKDAQGGPLGNFPTWRCNDGKLRNNKLCPGEPKLGGMKVAFVYDYLRMQSRQTFAYGALFNLTGNPEYLKLHKAGVKFILEKGRDPKGGYFTYFQKGEPLPEDPGKRTAQNLSYAIVGLAMNAYLTHDPKVIKEIMDTQKFIYDNYFDKDKGYLVWAFKDSVENKASQIELVAQLDQIYAYLYTTWRLVPEAKQEYWTQVIMDTIGYINKNFYDEKTNRYHGCLDNKSCFSYLSGRHTDYGHRVKCFWMQYLCASMIGDKDLMAFAKKGMLDTLKDAETLNKDSWFDSDTKDDASWWAYAELDQVALTLALTDDYDLPKTFLPWINEMTDHEYGEMKAFMKTNFWRNGFHSTEHALIGTILSNAIRAKECADDKCKVENEVPLYFAPVNKEDRNFSPYYYSGDVVKVENEKNGIEKVVFNNITLPVLAK